MTPKRILGCILLLIGIGAAVVPLLMPESDDSAFLGILRQKTDWGGTWTSRGSLWTAKENRNYSYVIEQKARENAKGNVAEAMRTLVATDTSGRNVTYRLTHEFSEQGALLDVVAETPTRTVRKSRGPTGRDPAVETVVADTSPFYTRPPFRWACHGIGSALILAGFALLILGGRRSKPLRRESEDE